MGRVDNFITFPYILPSAMPINEAAARRQESKARDSRGEYESNATTAAWRDGVNDADSPGEGLEDAGAQGLDTAAFDNKWRDGVNDAEFSVDADAWEAGLDGDAWLDSMRNASDWNI